jgi:hypothetical protein
MHRMRTRRHTSGTSFRSSIKRALAALYKRRGEIEDLIWFLKSQSVAKGQQVSDDQATI